MAKEDIMKYDFFCFDEDGDAICVEARTYAEAIRKFFAGEERTVRKAHVGYKVTMDGVTYKIKRG